MPIKQNRYLQIAMVIDYIDNIEQYDFISACKDDKNKDCIYLGCVFLVYFDPLIPGPQVPP